MQQFLTRGSSLSALFGAIAAFGFSGQTLAQTPGPTQTLSTMMYFDGVSPQGGLVTDGVALYGATSAGNAALGGLLYRLALDTNSPLPPPISTIYEYGRLDVWTGATPGGALLRGSDGNLYGTTQNSYINIDPFRGGTFGTGTVFRVSADGKNYAKLAEFEPLTLDSVRTLLVNNTGATPSATLAQGTEAGIHYLYGTTLAGGNNGTGTVFKIRADGVNGIIKLHSFAVRTNSITTDIPIENADGARVTSRLHVDSNGYLYGVAPHGGTNKTGTIFRVSTDQANPNFQVLHTFNAIIPGDATATPPVLDRNIGGAYPQSGLTPHTGFLYGTTSSFGANGVGNVYRIATDGSGFFVIRSFNGADGANPSGDLIITNTGKLAGTTQTAGTLATDVVGAASGTVYTLSLDGATYNEECVFNVANAVLNGAAPQNGVIQTADGNFYGTTAAGGYSNDLGGTYGLLFKCGSEHAGPVLGVRPPYDDGGSGALPMWVIAMLAALLVVQISRRISRR